MFTYALFAEMRRIVTTFHSDLLSSIPYSEKNTAISQKKESIFFNDGRVSIDRRENQYSVSIYADMMKVRKTDAPPPPHGIFRRAAVTGFSAKSRKRMIEMLASVTTVPDLFCTLTFSDDTYAREDFDPKYYFELFRHYLEYHYPDIIAIWRMEAEERKSGEFTGDKIPHFHLLIWLPQKMVFDMGALLNDEGLLWRTYWHEVTGSTNEYHLLRYGLQLQQIKSRRHAYHYASKYVSKTKDDNLEIGRRWGVVGQVDDLPVFEIEMSAKQFKELKRLITSYGRRQNKYIAKKLSGQKSVLGFTVFGLGAWNENNRGLEQSIIWQIVGLSIALANRNATKNRNPKQALHKNLVATNETT